MGKKPPKPTDKPARPRFVEAKKKLDARIGPDLQKFMDAIKDGYPFLSENASDSDVVLSATSGLDLLLRIAISTTFRAAVSIDELKGIFEGTNGPLGTFDSKIRVCAALNLVQGDFQHDLDLIRAIRNIFAHSIVVRGFEDNEIKNRCSQLKCKTQKLYTITSIPKRQFVESCVRVCQYLVVSISFSIISLEFIANNKEKLVPAATFLAGEILKAIGFSETTQMPEVVQVPNSDGPKKI